MSLRRAAEFVRSCLGHQERWRWWRPLDTTPAGEVCYLAVSTVHRWLDEAGVEAQASVPGQLQGIGQSEKLGTDGLWVKLRGGARRVILLLVDSVSGLLWPPVIAKCEEQAASWQRLFERARQAALVWAIYHNFEPAQRRSERKRCYRHPGQSPLQVAGAPPGEISYLDALAV